MDTKELVAALNLVVQEKGIDKEIIYEAIEASLLSACKKNYSPSQNARVELNKDTGDIKIFASKEVVEEVYDSALEVSLEDAREISSSYEIGDFVEFEVTPKSFDRIAAQTAKQVFVQKFREAEREKLYNEYIVKEKDIDTAIVQRTERRNVIVSLGKMEAVLPFREQIPGEEYKFNDRLKVYILEVRQTPKGPQISVSRTHYELVKRLFELEVPEIYDGTVEIKSIAREAGSRTKMAVYSKKPEVDPVGACVGHNGSRVNVIVNELGGEKIDIITWSENPEEFIRAALNPAKVIAVAVEDTETEKLAKVVVADNQLSLAIGKEGQNVRLAAKLTGRKIDIKSEAQARATGFIDFSAVDGEDEYYADEDYDDSEDYADEDYDDSEDYADEDYDDSEDYDDYDENEDYDDYEDEYEGEEDFDSLDPDEDFDKED